MNLRRAKGDLKRYNAFSQLLIMNTPSDELPGTQIQIYPHFDSLFRCAVPPALWALLGWTQQMARGRVLWARLYSQGKAGMRYRLTGNKKEPLEVVSEPDRGDLLKILQALRRELRASGFWIPPVQPAQSKTSSHLSGPFSWQHEAVDAQGQVTQGLHIVDGTLFPESPVTSPTFAIMANAMRIGFEVCK